MSQRQSTYFEAYKSQFLVLSNESSRHDAALIAKLPEFCTMDEQTCILVKSLPLLGTP